MPVPTNTYQTTSAKGLREDLSDVISRIDPTEVPFQSNIGAGSCKAIRTEWQIQNLAAANADNAEVEGADASNDASQPTTRVGNIVQISDKVAQVSTTLEAVDKAGRDSEMAYQLVLKGLELRRDIEKRLVGNYASQVGDGDTVPGKCAGLEAWLTSNVSRGTGGANGGYGAGTGLVAAATDGTLRGFTEPLLGDVHQSCYTNGGRPSMLMLPPGLKRKFSTFAGIAAQRVDNTKAQQVSIIGGADVYVGDFGTLTTTVNIFMSTRSALLIDTKMAKKRTLVKMKQDPLAKTGHSERKMISEQYTLEVTNEAAHGVVADIQAA